MTLLAYDSATGHYTGDVVLNGEALKAGQVQVKGTMLPGGSLNSTYTSQQTDILSDSVLYAPDGNFELHLPPHFVAGAISPYVVTSLTGFVPGPLPTDKVVNGATYSIQLEAGITALEKTALVKMYLPAQNEGSLSDIAIYRWSATEGGWLKVEGATFNAIDSSLTAEKTEPEVYVLLDQSIRQLYLPLVMKSF